VRTRPASGYHIKKGLSLFEKGPLNSEVRSWHCTGTPPWPRQNWHGGSTPSCAAGWAITGGSTAQRHIRCAAPTITWRG